MVHSFSWNPKRNNFKKRTQIFLIWKRQQLLPPDHGSLVDRKLAKAAWLLIILLLLPGRWGHLRCLRLQQTRSPMPAVDALDVARRDHAGFQVGADFQSCQPVLLSNVRIQFSALATNCNFTIRPWRPVFPWLFKIQILVRSRLFRPKLMIWLVVHW